MQVKAGDCRTVECPRVPTSSRASRFDASLVRPSHVWQLPEVYSIM